MQHGFTKGRPCQTHLISFFEKGTMRAAGEVFLVKIGKHSCPCMRPRWYHMENCYNPGHPCFREIPSSWKRHREVSGKVRKMDVRCLAVQPNKGWLTGDVSARSSLGKRDPAKIKSTGTEPIHTKWSKVNSSWKQNELQKLCSPSKGFQQVLRHRKLTTSQAELQVCEKGWPNKVTRMSLWRLWVKISSVATQWFSDNCYGFT